MSNEPAERPKPTVYENRGGEVWERHADGRRELFAADIIARLTRLERERDEARELIAVKDRSIAAANQTIMLNNELMRQATDKLAEVREQRDRLAAQFTKLDKPKYSGAPMMDKVLAVRNPEFDAWVQTLPATYWTRYDLSAARIGWEAAKGGIQ